MQALGPVGRYVVGAFALSEFYGGSCIVLIVIWRELQGVLPRDASKRCCLRTALAFLEALPASLVEHCAHFMMCLQCV